jgi:hypothetical protein
MLHRSTHTHNRNAHHNTAGGGGRYYTSFSAVFCEQMVCDPYCIWHKDYVQQPNGQYPIPIKGNFYATVHIENRRIHITGEAKAVASEQYPAATD